MSSQDASDAEELSQRREARAETDAADLARYRATKLLTKPASEPSLSSQHVVEGFSVAASKKSSGLAAVPLLLRQQPVATQLSLM
jgi:hypothetical protein